MLTGEGRGWPGGGLARAQEQLSALGLWGEEEGEEEEVGPWGLDGGEQAHGHPLATPPSSQSGQRNPHWARGSAWPGPWAPEGLQGEGTRHLSPSAASRVQQHDTVAIRADAAAAPASHPSAGSDPAIRTLANTSGAHPPPLGLDPGQRSRPSQLPARAGAGALVDLFQVASTEVEGQAPPVGGNKETGQHGKGGPRVSLQHLFHPPSPRPRAGAPKRSPPPPLPLAATAGLSQAELFGLDLGNGTTTVPHNAKLDLLLSTISSFQPPPPPPSEEVSTMAVVDEARDLALLPSQDLAVPSPNSPEEQASANGLQREEAALEAGTEKLVISPPEGGPPPDAPRVPSQDADMEREARTSANLSPEGVGDLFQAQLQQDEQEGTRLQELEQLLSKCVLEQQGVSSPPRALHEDAEAPLQPAPASEAGPGAARTSEPALCTILSATRSVSSYATADWSDSVHLDLTRLQLGCVEGLVALAPHLASTILDDNALVFLDGLSPHLEMLSVRGNRLSDMTSFVHFHALRELDVSHNQLSDVTSLCHLDGLCTLRAAGNALTQVDALLELPGLQHLDLSFNQVTALQVLPHLLEASSLRVLRLRGNRITHVSALPARLEELDLGRNRLMDEGILHLSSPTLGHLDLSHNELAHFDTARFPALRTLKLEYNSLQELIVAPSLEHLGLHGQRSAGMALALREGDFRAMLQLTRLDASASRIVSLYPLVHLQALTELDLGGLELTRLPDHLPPTLRRLALAHNQLQDVEALVGLTRLKELDVRDNQFGDLSALLSVLGQFPLERLDLRDNVIPETRISRHPTTDVEVVKRLCYRALFIYSLRHLRLLDAVPISPLDRRLSKSHLLKVRRCKLRR